MAAADQANRARVLGAVRAALGRGPLPQARALALDRALERPASHTVPARGRPDDLAAAFAREAEAAQCEVVRLDSRDAVPAAIADRLAALNLPPSLRLAPSPELQALPWETRPLLEVKVGPGDAGALVGVAMADAGIAETGTLVLTSGATGSTTLNFIPDVQFVVLPEDRLAGPLEDAWTRLRAAHGANWPPRTVNLVTGPSRTGDIETRLVMGAHGPRRLVVLMVPGA
jgi:L-lactate dehydrogenase complex protein LldG